MWNGNTDNNYNKSNKDDNNVTKMGSKLSNCEYWVNL